MTSNALFIDLDLLLLRFLRRESHFLQECALRGPCFIAVALRVEIERRLDARMTQNTLHGLGGSWGTCRDGTLSAHGFSGFLGEVAVGELTFNGGSSAPHSSAFGGS